MIVNCVARVPLFQPDGNPVLEWKKNEHGNRIGDKPVPIEPDNYVLVIDESEDRDMAEAVEYMDRMCNMHSVHYLL